MVLKRNFSDKEDDVGSDVPSQESKRRLTFATIVRDVMRGLSAHEFLTQLEPILRSVVREEVERALLPLLHSSPRSSRDQPESSRARACQLHFVDKLPHTIFTGNEIESVDGNPVKIVILDSVSRGIITSGPLSSVKAEIVVLDGDFGAVDQEDWTEMEFNAKVVREREGKRPLVTGKLQITLQDGVGFVGDVSFTDNSSWIRSRRFRLGARIVQSNSTEARIREARSEAFVVKDHRGESYRKHHPPNLEDDIWRLEKIAKGGTSHTRLAAHGITTVKDFLQSYHVDRSSLRKVFGGISNKIWKTIIEHATECIVDDKLYIYQKEGERIGLLFNSIFNVVGASFDGGYQSRDKLSEFQMGLVEKLKRDAYKNLNDLVPLDAPSAVGPAMPPSNLLPDPYGSSGSHLQDVDFSGVHQDQMETQLASSHMTTTTSLPSSHMTMTTSLPYSYNVQEPELSMTQFCHPMQIFTPTFENSLMEADSRSGHFAGGTSWAPVMQISNLTAEYDSQVGTSTWQGNGLFFAPRNDCVGLASSDFGIRFSRNGKPKARWCMLRAAVKWGLVRRDVAAKRMARQWQWVAIA